MPRHTSIHSTTTFDNLNLIAALKNSQSALAQLPAFLRTLLVADGTITRSLEAFFWEPIDIIQIEQQEQQCPTDFPQLELAKGTTALFRQVELRGRQSGKLYSKADSIIKTNDIPCNWRKELLAGRLGIGTLISDSGMESYREIISYELDCHSKNQGDVSRQYRIFLENHPTILISESFPISTY